MPYYFGVNNGASDTTVAQQATTTGRDVEIVINTNANVPTKQALVEALERLMIAIQQSVKAW